MSAVKLLPPLCVPEIETPRPTGSGDVVVVVLVVVVDVLVVLVDVVDVVDVLVAVVGVVVVPGELAASTTDNSPLHLTPAFYRTYRGRVGMADAVRIRLKRGSADVVAFHEWPEHWFQVGLVGVFSVLILAFGLAVFNRLQGHFAEEL